MFLRGSQSLGLLSLVFIVVKSSDLTGKWFIHVGQFVISTSDFIAFDQNAIKRLDFGSVLWIRKAN